MVKVKNDALAHQIFQSTEFPQVRTERVAEKNDLKLMHALATGKQAATHELSLVT